MQGYMWLWDCKEAQIDFVLFPTPFDLIPAWQSPEKYVDLVEQIPQDKRITTRFKRGILPAFETTKTSGTSYNYETHENVVFQLGAYFIF